MPGVQFSLESKNQIINTYRNVVRWSVDEFWRQLLVKADLKDTLIIYTSDHGQNLMDDPDLMTHCNVQRSIPQEALVPLLIYGGNSSLITRLQQTASQNFGHSSHFQIFPTLLFFLGYDQQMTNSQYGPDLLTKSSDKLEYTTGSIAPGLGHRLRWFPALNP
ncbi:MAG: sulfatase-like hydrolase/transferase [Pseudomonadota bacterium]